MDLLRELERTRDETLGYFGLAPGDLARSYAPGKWSIAFILHHLADSDTVLYERIRRTLSEPRPVLWVYDQDAWAQGLDYGQMSLDVSRGVYRATRDAILHYARRFYHSHGQREFVHSVTGVRTLQMEFDKVAEHNEHHLTQIRQALATAR